MSAASVPRIRPTSCRSMPASAYRTRRQHGTMRLCHHEIAIPSHAQSCPVTPIQRATCASDSKPRARTRTVAHFWRSRALSAQQLDGCWASARVSCLTIKPSPPILTRDVDLRRANPAPDRHDERRAGTATFVVRSDGCSSLVRAAMRRSRLDGMVRSAAERPTFLRGYRPASASRTSTHCLPMYRRTSWSTKKSLRLMPTSRAHRILN